MATYGDYRPFTSELDPSYMRTLQQMLSGQLTDAQSQQLEKQKAQELRDIESSYASRGAPGGAWSAAKRSYLENIGLGAADMARQQQLYGLQYGGPYMQQQAQQYWMPQQMELQRYGLQQNETPWYQQALGFAGGLAGDIFTPWALNKYAGKAAGLGAKQNTGGYDLPSLPPY